MTQVGNVITGSWSPDGRLLAVTNEGGNSTPIHLWDVPSRRPVGVLEGHKNSAVRTAFSPTGNLLASNGWEVILRLWDPRTERQLLRLSIGGIPNSTAEATASYSGPRNRNSGKSPMAGSTAPSSAIRSAARMFPMVLQSVPMIASWQRGLRTAP